MDALLAGMTRENFDEWLLSDHFDHTLSGLDRLTRTVAEVGAVLASQVPHDLQPWQFIPGEREPDDTDAEIDSITTRIDASMRQLAAASYRGF